jgi:hypothetical protein
MDSELMTYEPGTSDIMTTLDEPFPDPREGDEKIFADLFRYLLNGSGLSGEVDEPWKLHLPGGHWIYLTQGEQVDAVQRYVTELNAARTRWQERLK